MIEALTVRAIATRHNLRRQARSWRGDCPACGYRGTFTVREGRDGAPRLFCASRNDRDAIARAIGLQRPAPPNPQQDAAREADRARKREAALRLWNGAEAVPDTPAAAYLRARGIPLLTACPDLRFRGDTPHPEGGRLPALIALVRDAIGEPLAIHRTYLRRDGTGKASVNPQKASLGPVWGGAIRLAPLSAELVVGEGIESAAAAGVLAGLPSWAAVSAGNLAAGLVLPHGVRSVVLFEQHGVRSAKGQTKLLQELQAAGFRTATFRRANRGTGQGLRHPSGSPVTVVWLNAEVTE